LTRRGWHKAVGRGRATGLRSARKESGEGEAAHREGERAFDPLGDGAGLRPAEKGGPLEPMWPPTCLLCRVFRSVYGQAPVLRAAFDQRVGQGGRSSTTRTTPHTPSVLKNAIIKLDAVKNLQYYNLWARSR